jgi:hypothetical protein
MKIMDLANIIGKRVTSAEVAEFETLVGEVAKRDPRPAGDDRAYWTYANRKLEVMIDTKSDRVTTVFIAPSSASQIDGLRYPLSFNMSHDTVRSVIGRAPDDSKESPRYDLWEEKDYKLRVEYIPEFRAIKLIVLLAA